MIAIDLRKQQALDADPKAMQQINFIENLDRPEDATMFFVNEEAKESILDFSQGFLERILVPLLKTGLRLVRSVLKPLAISILIALGLPAAASGTCIFRCSYS